MPTYEYECAACGHSFDEFQQISDKHLRTCPKCGKRKLQRLIGAGAAVIFKGSGFYQTDYRSDSYKSEAKKDAPASDAPASDKAAAGADKSDSTPGKAEGKKGADTPKAGGDTK